MFSAAQTIFSMLGSLASDKHVEILVKFQMPIENKAIANSGVNGTKTSDFLTLPYGMKASGKKKQRCNWWKKAPRYDSYCVILFSGRERPHVSTLECRLQSTVFHCVYSVAMSKAQNDVWMCLSVLVLRTFRRISDQCLVLVFFFCA